MIKIAAIISVLLLAISSFGQVISPVAGNGSSGYSGDGGDAILAELDHPWSITTDGSGNIYFSEQSNHVIRRVDAISGEISTFVGTGIAGVGSDTDLAPDFAISSPSGITYNNGFLYFCTFGFHKIYKVSLADSSVTHVAGVGLNGYSIDGTDALSAELGSPEGIAIGTDGLVYFSEYGNSIIRRIQTDGTLYTVAGIQGISGSIDGPITSATIGQPFGICIDDQNNIFLAQPVELKIRKIDQTAGTVSTVVGTGSLGDSPDGTLASSASISTVHGVSIDQTGDIYWADNDNYKIKKVSITDGEIYTIAGDGNLGNNISSGVPLNSQIGEPLGIHIDANGAVYFTDISFETVKKITECTPADTPIISVSTSDTLDCGEQITLTLSGDLNSQDYWQWYTGSCDGDEAGTGNLITPSLTYSTTFYAISKGNCISQDDCAYHIVHVSECLDPSDTEINAFSPNGDGVNDFLFINQAVVESNNLVVFYNRWGDPVKTIVNYNNESVSWDGSNEFGIAVEGGTYFYIFESDNISFSKWISVTK